MRVNCNPPKPNAPLSPETAGAPATSNSAAVQAPTNPAEHGSPIQLKNILFLTDFSEPSETALPFATALEQAICSASCSPACKSEQARSSYGLYFHLLTNAYFGNSFLFMRLQMPGVFSCSLEIPETEPSHCPCARPAIAGTIRVPNLVTPGAKEGLLCDD